MLVTQYYPPEMGAPQVRLSSFARELLRKGHKVVVLTGMPNYPSGVVQKAYRKKLIVRETMDGIPVVRTWLYATNSVRFVPRLTSYLSFCLTSFVGTLFVGRPDAIFVESPPLFLAISAHFIAKLLRSRWIMNVSDLWPDTVLEMGLLGPGRALSASFALERWAYSRADFVVGVTRGICDRLVNEKGLDPSKVLFLPNGADTLLFQPKPRDAELERQLGLAGKKLFLFAGLHGHAQDLPTILNAAESLKHRSDIMIGFVGDGPVKPWAVGERDSRGLSNVFFVPPQPLAEMPQYWSLATAALVTLRDLPLFDGARPSKSFPPMASGLPIIFAGRGEMANLIDQSGAGIVVPPEDAKAVAAAICRLADAPETVSSMGDKARTLILEHFSWGAITDQWLKDYETGRDLQRVARE